VIESAWLVPFFPLLGALVVAAGGRWLKGHSHWPIVAGIAAAFLVSLGLVSSAGPKVAGHHEGGGGPHASAAAEAAEPATGEPSAERSRTVVVYPWLQLGARHATTVDGQTSYRYDLEVPIEFRVDGLTAMMLAMVTFVATLVTLFAAGYMAGDPGYPRFFSVVGLFVFSMTGLVLSNNYVLTYAFWEGVGVCSYLLIGYWHAKPSAAAAAKKAFLVNRIGDVGFALAIFWMWATSEGHSLSYDAVLGQSNLAQMMTSTKLGIALLLFWAATAKSAQIPLYVWLPDAMEGPTPVSALIHAATMVTAGVYLIARSAPLVFAVPYVPPIISGIGGATALLAAAMAVTQTDLKRVLAYSTISQLGYMFMALGTGVGNVMLLAVVAAMFHLFTHAFFKALLFLGSGSVMHAMGGVIDMRRFRGLRHRLPHTHWTFLIGSLSLAGIFPLAGFWSKDEILAALGHAGHATHGTSWAWVYPTVYWLAVLTAFLTAFYTGRAYFLTFWGPEKLPSPDDPEADPSERGAHGHGHGEIDPHRPAPDPPPTPGATDEPVPQTAAHGHGDHGHDSHFGHESPPIMTIPLWVLAGCTVLVGLLFGPLTGMFEGLLERTPTWAGLAPPEGHGTDWLSVGVGTLVGVLGLLLAYVLYAKPSAVPAQLARQAGPLYRASYQKFWVDELYHALVVRPTRFLAQVMSFLDKYLIDGLVKLVAWIPRIVGRDLLAPFQNGLIQFYAAVSALGVAALLLILLFWQS
jgi:NADH-quinone oxidoreductase subunit L